MVFEVLHIGVSPSVCRLRMKLLFVESGLLRATMGTGSGKA